MNPSVPRAERDQPELEGNRITLNLFRRTAICSLYIYQNVKTHKKTYFFDILLIGSYVGPHYS